MRWIPSLLMVAAVSGSFAQPQPTFEVASVKPSPHADRGFRTRIRGGPGTEDPERFSEEGLSLGGLLYLAYGIPHYQVSAPGWVDTETFDVTAKVPKGASREQFRMMLQSLLAERFSMAVHWEKRAVTGYDLVAARTNVQLRKSVAGDGSHTEISVVNGTYDMQARHTTMDELTEMVAGQVDRPVSNATGLAGEYDFHLIYLPDFGPPKIRMPEGGGSPVMTPSDAGPSLFEALQQQLGLRLEKKTAVPMDTLVVDHAERRPLQN